MKIILSVIYMLILFTYRKKKIVIEFVILIWKIIIIVFIKTCINNMNYYPFLSKFDDQISLTCLMYVHININKAK